MSLPSVDWNELKLSEDPAVELLRSLGYTYVAPEAVEKERDNFKDAIHDVDQRREHLRQLEPRMVW